jgi:hypothetical protein
MQWLSKTALHLQSVRPSRHTKVTWEHNNAMTKTAWHVYDSWVSLVWAHGRMYLGLARRREALVATGIYIWPPVIKFKSKVAILDTEKQYVIQCFKYRLNKSTCSTWVCCQPVSVATNWTTRVRSPAWATDLSSPLCVQTGSGAHPTSCAMGTGGSFPGGVKLDRDVKLTTYPI